MKIRRLLSLLLAAILCFTIAISLIACEDDPVEEETTAGEDTVAPDDGGEVVEGDEVEEGGGEEAVG